MTAVHISRPRILEQDIDVILAYRLQHDYEFAAAFVAEAALRAGVPPVTFEAVRVKRQARHVGASGTIDILTGFATHGRETVLLLIENKVDSPFTPDQPERYAASATAMTTGGRRALTVLCAPRGYIARSRLTGPFACRIAYEDIAAWLDGPDRDDILAAVARFEMPYEPDPVPEVANFFEGYRELARLHVPDLVVKKAPNSGGVRPMASRTIYFDTSRSLPRYDFLPTLRFSHQCWDSGAQSPSVKVMISGWAPHAPAISRIAADALRGGPIHIRAAGESLGLVINTPRMDNLKPVSRQVDAVLTGLRAASALRAWMFENGQELQRWAVTTGQ